MSFTSALELLYEANSPRIEGIPRFDAIDPRYLPPLGKPFRDGVSWGEFTEEVDREHKHLSAQADPRMPIFSDEERKGWCAIEIGSDAHLRAKTFDAFASFTPSPVGGDDVLAVYTRVTERFAWWYHLPRTGVEEKNADFAFYRMRCVLSGASFTHWKVLAAGVVSQLAECPFNPQETEEEWSELLAEAHRTCGWPTTIGWIDWSAVPDQTGSASDWMRLVALFHVFKHVRRAPDHLHIAYTGSVEFMPIAQRTNRSLGTPAFWATYSRVLGKPPGKDSMKSDALQWALARLGLDDLLPCKPIAELPGAILAGPWSTLLPLAGTKHAGTFLTPGTRLSGVWRAANGRVTPYEGDGSDCLDWSWNTSSAGAAEVARTSYETRLPRTYPQVAPSHLLAKSFPHWMLPDEGTPDRDAYCAIVDSVFCASILRAERDDLTREYPLIVILPLMPSAEESTNQGKGLLTQAIAGAFVPGIRLLTAPDSGSAPDSRSIAHELEQYGTLALDEFQIPLQRAHVLSRDNLQSLCTGGEVTSGKVLENAGKVRLRQSLVLNAKWVDMSDDLVNRTVPLFLDALTDAQRARTDIKEMLENGQFAILLRLAAVSLVEACQLSGLGTQVTGNAGSGAWRFTAHRTLAATILVRRHQARNFESAFAMLDECRSSMGDDLRRHQQMADESGISASTSSGVNLRLSWHTFWVGVDETMLQNFLGFQSQHGEVRAGDGGKWVSLTALFRFRLEAMGASSLSFSRLLPALTGQDIRCSNTAVVRSFSLGCRSYWAQSFSAKRIEWSEIPGEAGKRWEIACLPRAWGGNTSASDALVINVRQKGIL